MKYQILHTKEFYLNSSNQFVTTCPSCKKKKHFDLDKYSGLFNCKQCGISGNFYQYIDLINSDGKNSEYIKQLYEVGNIFKLDKIEFDNTDEDFTKPSAFIRISKVDDAYRYITRKRGFDKSLIKKYNIFQSISTDTKFANKVIFPVEDSNGIIVGFCARDMSNITEMKYYNSKGTKFSKYLFNFNNIKNNNYDFVIIVEGIFDCLRLRNFAVCSFGKKISEEQISLLQELDKKKYIIMFDDNAIKENYKYALKLCDIFPNVYVFNLPSHDPDKYFKDYMRINGNHISDYILKNSKRILSKRNIGQVIDTL